MATDPTRSAVSAALEVIEAAHAQATSSIKSEADPEEALLAVRDLVARLRKLTDDDAELRMALVARIWASESLSLAKLAERIGVSKTRADQLVRKIKQSEGS